MNVFILIMSCFVLFILNLLWMKRTRPKMPSMMYIIRKNMKVLPLYIVGLWGFIFMGGYFETKLVETPYMRPTFVMAFTRTCSFVFTGIVLKYKFLRPMHPSPFSIPAIMNILATGTQLEALEYVSFPEFGAAKALRLIFVGLYDSKSLLEKILWTIASLIGASFIFWYDFDHAKWIYPGHMGIMWLTVFVICDSLTSISQQEIYKKFKVPSIQMMFYINFWMLIIILPQIFIEEKLFEHTIMALMNSGWFAFDLIMLTISSAAAQFFALCLIREFGALTFTVSCLMKSLLSISIIKYVNDGYWSWFEILELIIIFVIICYVLMIRKPWKKRNKVPSALKIDLMPLISED